MNEGSGGVVDTYDAGGSAAHDQPKSNRGIRPSGFTEFAVMHLDSPSYTHMSFLAILPSTAPYRTGDRV